MTLLERPGDVRTPASGLAYNLAGIAVLVLLIAVGAAYFLDKASRDERAAIAALGDGNPVVQTIAGRELTIPARWFRFGEQIRTGFTSQADLTFQLDLGDGAGPLPVDVVLLPKSRARSSGALLDAVYLHLFDDGTLEGVPGLVGKPLVARDGYAHESVWYDPLSPAPFVAKCMTSVDEKASGRCLRTVHLASGIAAVVSFDARGLAGWRQFDTDLARWLGQIGAL